MIISYLESQFRRHSLADNMCLLDAFHEQSMLELEGCAHPENLGSRIASNFFHHSERLVIDPDCKTRFSIFCFHDFWLFSLHPCLSFTTTAIRRWNL